jgi:hypothetical protein
MLSSITKSPVEAFPAGSTRQATVNTTRSLKTALQLILLLTAFTSGALVSRWQPRQSGRVPLHAAAAVTAAAAAGTVVVLSSAGHPPYQDSYE